MSWYSMEEMGKLLKEVPPSDPDMTEAIYYDVIREGYLLYDHKAKKAACTRCGHVWEISPSEYAGMSHEEDSCPMCGSRLTCLSAGRGRMRFAEYHRVMSFAEKDGTLWAILNEIVPIFDNFGRPDLRRTLRAIYKLDAKEQRYWKLIEPWGQISYYTEPKTLTVPSPKGMIYGWSKYEDHVYSAGIKEMILQSDAKYLYEDFMQFEPKMSMVPYIASQLRNPSVELLRKAGFINIAKIKLNGYGGARCVNWRGDSLEKILKLPKRWVRYLRPHDPSAAELTIFQHLSEEERIAGGIALMSDMAHSYRDESRYREVVEEYMPFIKWAKLVNGWDCKCHRSSFLGDYEDYIRVATKLGMDITKKSIRFPKNLEEAHDRVCDEWEAVKDERTNAMIAAKARLVTDYVKGNLTIFAATSQEDLNKESAGLCHCVKTYGSRIADGRCWIFFIRNIESPDKPFYTMETTTEGKLVQCRGLHNCGMTDEVKAFTETFINDLQKQIKKERRTLCQTT